MPKVTVFMPVYNREQYVKAAIESILSQRFSDFELLVIDDGSTDRSVAIVQSYTSDRRVRLVCHACNEGIPKTRNQATALARGEYLAMLDSDDTARPQRLAKQVQFLDRHPEYALVGSWTQRIDADGQLLRGVRFSPASPGEVRARLLFQGGPIQSTVMARTAILRAHPYDEQYTVCEDYDLWIRLARRYPLGNLPEVLVQSRRHTGRITYEQTTVIRDHCLHLTRTQLTELGIAFTALDIERHFLLLRMAEHHFIPDVEYVAWAEAWLHKVKDANARMVLYPQRPLERLLGQIWFVVCWRATRGVGTAVWKQFWRSPLHRDMWSSVSTYICTRAFHRMPRD